MVPDKSRHTLIVAEAPSKPAYLLAEMNVRDADGLSRYARDVAPLMARHGGHILAVSTVNPRVIEGSDDGRLMAIHCWRSQADFDAFFASSEYQPLKRLRRAAADTRIVIFDAPSLPTLMPILQGAGADADLADGIVFRSPAAEYTGRADVLHVLRTIAKVVQGITATSVSDDGAWRTRTLSARIQAWEVQGILRERCDLAGRIAEAELYLRPYEALRAGVAEMKARLERERFRSSREP